jgi:hypothetical protein
MDRIPVESTLLRSVGYDPATATLELELRRGRIYQFYEVPEETLRELLAADSKGRYFNANIKDQYPYRRVL